MDNVLVCRYCGKINLAEGTTWCNNCGTFSGVARVSSPEAEQLSHRKRTSLLLRRGFRSALAMTLIMALTFWVAWTYFDFGPNPPDATTDLSASIDTGTWAQGRRTPQNTGFTPTSAPFPQEVKWVYATSKPLLVSPAVVGDYVYLTTEDGRIVALERQTGHLLWEYPTGFPASSTPAVAGDLVLFTLRPGQVLALDRETGKLIWERDLESPILASPVVANGSIYIGSADSKLYALDAATGKDRWAFATEDWIISSVAYADGSVIVASADRVLNVVSAKTGRRRLLYDTGRGRRVGGSPVVQGDLAYFGSQGGRVWAIDWRARTFPLERGILFWHSTFYVWGLLPNAPVQKGSVWAKQVAGDVTVSPALAHGAVYVVNTEGEVVAMDAATGEHRWTTDLGVEITAAPTVAGNTVLIGTDPGTVFGVDAGTGNVLWEFKTEGKITGSPIVVGDSLYVVSHDGKLYAVGEAE